MLSLPLTGGRVPIRSYVTEWLSKLTRVGELVLGEGLSLYRCSIVSFRYLTVLDDSLVYNLSVMIFDGHGMID